MGVASKEYTLENIKDMKADDLRSAVPQILKAFNDGGRNDMKLWEVYHEAALKLDASNVNFGSQNEWRQKLYEGATSFNPLSL